MKLLSILIFIPFIAFAQAPMPDWAKRENSKLQEDEYIWFLGISDSSSLSEARNESDNEAKRHIAEFLSNNTSLFSKTLVAESLNDTKSNTKVISYSKHIKVPLKKRRTYFQKSEGRYINYSDIAILKSDVKKIKENSQTIPFDQATNEQELDTTTEDVNENYEKSLTYLDYHHQIAIEMQVENDIAFGLSYQYSFLRKRLGLQFSFASYSNEEETYSNSKAGYEFNEYTFYYYDLNIAMKRTHHYTLNLSIGHVRAHFKEGVNEARGGDSSSEKTKELSGTSVGLKYHSLFYDSHWGYTLEARHLMLEGENFDGSDTKENTQKLTIGLMATF